VVCVVGEVVGSLGLEASTRYSMARVVNR
jgi:hypothetical protein